jgi:hypothetical protein
MCYTVYQSDNVDIIPIKFWNYSSGARVPHCAAAAYSTSKGGAHGCASGRQRSRRRVLGCLLRCYIIYREERHWQAQLRQCQVP